MYKTSWRIHCLGLKSNMLYLIKRHTFVCDTLLLSQLKNNNNSLQKAELGATDIKFSNIFRPSLESPGRKSECMKSFTLCLYTSFKLFTMNEDHTV